MGCCGGRSQKVNLENRKAGGARGDGGMLAYNDKFSSGTGGGGPSNRTAYNSKNFMGAGDEEVLKVRLQKDSLFRELLYAKEAKNMDLLIDMMTSDKALVESLEIGHPWAEMPSTGGSLACIYIGLIFEKPEETDYPEESKKNYDTWRNEVFF